MPRCKAFRWGKQVYAVWQTCHMGRGTLLDPWCGSVFIGNHQTEISQPRVSPYHIRGICLFRWFISVIRGSKGVIRHAIKPFLPPVYGYKNSSPFLQIQFHEHAGPFIHWLFFSMICPHGFFVLSEVRRPAALITLHLGLRAGGRCDVVLFIVSHSGSIDDTTCLSGCV